MVIRVVFSSEWSVISDQWFLRVEGSGMFCLRSRALMRPWSMAESSLVS